MARKPIIPLVSLLAMFLFAGAYAQNIDAVSAQGEARADDNAQAQQRVDQVADTIDDLVGQYKTLTKIVEGLQVYNNLLQKQIDNQNAELEYLDSAIDNVALIERQIVPTMFNMIDTLEDFVSADTPFLLDERSERVQRLRDMMERSDVTVAEKFRNVIEAYQIENEYGNTIEAYRGNIEIDGNIRDVEFLRIGRVALAYQTLDQKITGAWDGNQGAFVQVSAADYRNQVSQGLRVAKKEVAPDLLIIPVSAAKEAGQ